MKMITRRGIFLWILSILFVAGIVFLCFSFVQHGDEWAMKRYNKHLYSNGELIGAGTIYDSNDIALAQTVDGERVYAESKTTRKSTLHVVGDPKNFISSSVQATFDSKLTGYNLMFGVYSLKKYGKGNDLHLTIDSELCDIAYKALDGRKGTVGVVNYKTGDIVCCVSSPSYDVNDPPYDIDTNEEYEGVYINRLLTAHYVPGSTFKIVTAICAIENIPDIFERTWDCNGSYKPPAGGEIICMSDHGEGITFKDALAESCNSVFAQIAIELGEEKLSATAKELGIGTEIKISGEIGSFAGKFNIDGIADDTLGWTGIGQGETRIAPITMLKIVSAVANDGNTVSFNIVNNLSNQAGKLLNLALPTNKTMLLDSTVASKTKEMLRYNVTEEYGDSRFKGLNLCAKSGTAQTDSNPDHDISWFTGFMDNPDKPYAFVVVVENTSSGTGVAGPIANEVLQAVNDKY